MITNEREIRIALEATLACTLAFYGLWGCAFVVVLLMLPWGPLLAVGAYLVQPIVEWRVRTARIRRDKGVNQLVRELQVLLPKPQEALPAGERLFISDSDSPLEPSLASSNVEVGSARHDLRAPLAISPAIRSHLQSSRHAAFTDMDQEVEKVTFEGDTAEAVVKFQSSSVSGFVIRRRYVLRRADGFWQVESHEPAYGPDHSTQNSAPAKEMSVRC